MGLSFTLWLNALIVVLLATVVPLVTNFCLRDFLAFEVSMVIVCLVVL
jgi:hypothetical protein